MNGWLTTHQNHFLNKQKTVDGFHQAASPVDMAASGNLIGLKLGQSRVNLRKDAK